MKKKRSVAPNGDAIRTARLRKAWTTEVLSGRADCAVKTVENAERGKAIYANTLASIASALGVDYDSLIARPVEQKKPTNEQKRPTTEQQKPRTLESLIPTGRVESVFFILRREDRPIASDWFLDHLKSHAAIQDPIEVLENYYVTNPVLMPEGGVRIALLMTVRDFEEVFEHFTTKSDTDLKVVYLTAADLPHPHKRDDYLWYAPSAQVKPPHSHLYD